MALLPTYIQVGFEDDSGRISVVTYGSAVRLEDDMSNITDVYYNLEDVRSSIGSITSARLAFTKLVIDFGATGTADDASNNQIVGFTRCTALSGVVDSIEIPSWDADLFEQDVNNLLDADYQSAVYNLSQFLASPINWLTMDSFTQWSQSRARKGRQTVG